MTDMLNLSVYYRKKLLSEKMIRNSKNRQGSISLSEANIGQDVHVRRLGNILNQISLSDLAHVSQKCQSFARSAMYLETHFRQNLASNLVANLEQLQYVYANLKEVDLVSGVSEVLPQRSLQQDAILAEAHGQWTEAQTCYELLLSTQDNINHTNYQCRLSQVMINNGHYGRHFSTTSHICRIRFDLLKSYE